MERMLTSHQVAKLLNVWPHTLHRWEREGKLKPLRTPGGHSSPGKNGGRPGLTAIYPGEIRLKAAT